MRIIIYLLIFIFAVNAIARASEVNDTTVSPSEQQIAAQLAVPSDAQFEGQSNSTVSAEKNRKFLLSTGTEGRLDQSLEKENSVQRFSNDSLGIQMGSTQIILENSQFEEVSGNATLSVRRRFQDYMTWLSYNPSISSWSSIFAGGGLGAYQNSVDTSLSGTMRTNNSSWKALAGLNFGITAYVSIVFASLEMRAFLGDELDRQPQIAGVARVGLRF